MLKFDANLTVNVGQIIEIPNMLKKDKNMFCLKHDVCSLNVFNRQIYVFIDYTLYRVLSSEILAVLERALLLESPERIE